MATNIHETLGHIQKAIKAPKSQYNSFGKYHYRNCEDILEAAKQVMPDGHSLVISDEIVLIGERYYIKATATLSGPSGSVSNSAYAREAQDKKGMDDSQITGATSSYARKYALNGLFAIDDTKDADSDEKPKAQAAAKQQTQRQADIQPDQTAQSWINYINGGGSLEEIADPEYRKYISTLIQKV